MSHKDISNEKNNDIDKLEVYEKYPGKDVAEEQISQINEIFSE